MRKSKMSHWKTSNKEETRPVAGVYPHFGGRVIVPAKGVDLGLDRGVGRSEFD